MRRAILKQGDKTTAGGVVLEGIDSCKHHGTPITFIGAKIWCPACNAEGEIGWKGPHRKATMMGKQQALEGDLCLCKCDPPPVLLASQDSAWHVFEAHERGEEPGGQSMAGGDHGMYDQRFHLKNPRTGQPLRDMPYRIVTESGGKIDGRTDAQGYTQRVTANSPSSATLHVLEEVTPLNPEWDKYL